MHFVRPREYEAIMPPQLPMHREAVAVSGVAEIVGGLAITQRPTRRFARWWLLALLAAVFPANIYMALQARGGRGARRCRRPDPALVLYGRLPIQFVFAAWVWRATRSRRALRSRAVRPQRR